VITWTYSWPFTCETQAHRAIVALRTHLEQQLGRTPTIAVLAPTNALVARISETIATDKADPQDATKILPAIDHELNWDPELSAAGYVVASIMEWPGLPRIQALTGTLRAIGDFYRTKLAGGTTGARATIATIDNAIAAVQEGHHRPVEDRQGHRRRLRCHRAVRRGPGQRLATARARLHGAAELEEIFRKARLPRLFKATDALAWALIDAWNGRDAYTDAAQAVRRVLANETLEAAQAEPVAVSLMNMHKSKGKEFDAVIIAEGRYSAALLDPAWSLSRSQAARRLLRVAITRARYCVLLVRPSGATPLTG
jgi:DNA helicase-2/ATP-dependent DNA helicase PcrA